MNCNSQRVPNNLLRPKQAPESIKDYELQGLIGAGGFGQVFKARNVKTGQEVAIKTISKKLLQQAPDIQQRVKLEIRIHTHINHPAIVKFYSTFEDSDYVYLVLELCHTHLKQYLKDNGGILEESEVCTLMYSIVEGLQYLQFNNIIHRDLKPENILLTKDGKVRIADFGLSAEMKSPDEKHNSVCGTPNYMAPEMLDKKHGSEADLWSLGCILYKMLVGDSPFDKDEMEEKFRRIRSGSFTIPSNVSKEAKDLLLRLLNKDPKSRISLSQVFQHPFMKKSAKFGNSSVDSKMWTTESESGLGMLSQSTLSSSRTSRPAINGSSVARSSSLDEDRSFRDESKKVQRSVARRPDSPLVLLQSKALKSGTSLRPNSRSQYKCTSQTENCRTSSVQEMDIRTPCVSRTSVNQSSQGSRRSVSRNCHSKDVHDSVKENWNPCTFPSALDCSTPKHDDARLLARNTKCSHNRICNSCSHVVSCLCRGASEAQSQVATTNNEVVDQEIQKENESNSPKLPLFNTRYLRPMCQQTKKAVMSILSNGDVEMRPIHHRDHREIIIDVWRISSDGEWVKKYTLNNGLGLPLEEGGTQDPSESSCSKWRVDDLPYKHISKYKYASRFVQLVRKKTPKITLYSELAKSLLMGNEPRADFEACFYDGTKMIFVDEQTKIIESTGKVHFVREADVSELPIKLYRLWDHFNQQHAECTKLERLLAAHDDKARYFPVIVGRRPACDDVQPPPTSTPSHPPKSDVSSSSTSFRQPMSQLNSQHNLPLPGTQNSRPEELLKKYELKNISMATMQYFQEWGIT